METDDLAAVQTRGVGLGEHRALHAVETHQAIEGSEPEIAVVGLRDRNDGTLRQPFLGHPLDDIRGISLRSRPGAG